MKELWEATMQGERRLIKFCVQDFGGPPFIRMLTSSIRSVMSISNWEVIQKREDAFNTAIYVVGF
jgi:hypothetical protein